jgi:acid stress chaperone HdeA
MKLPYLIFSVAMLSIPALVFAEDSNNATPQKPITKWTCEEFVAIGEEFKPKAIYWASAHAKGGKKHKSTVLNIEGTEKVIPIVIDECTQQPKATFWDKLNNAWHKVETEAKADAKEIKTNLEDIKTNMVTPK